MIQLTPTAALYPLRAPDGPHVLGWRTIVRVVLMILGIRRWWRSRKQQDTHGPKEIAQPEPTEFSLSVWLQELHTINTSIRTPAQKAQALVEHLWQYLEQQLPKEDLVWYTLKDFTIHPKTTHLAVYIQQLYEIVYTDKKVTHKDIASFVRSLSTYLAGL